MVSDRCKVLVRNELAQFNIKCKSIDLGVVDIAGGITAGQQSSLNVALERAGLGIIVNKKRILVEMLKATIINKVHYSKAKTRSNLSVYLSKRLGYDYTYLANIFSTTEGTTLEKFMIAHKIERVKELLVYGDLTLTQIAAKLHYCSVSHLSHQFKRSTGVTPSVFKKRINKDRISLENV